MLSILSRAFSWAITSFGNKFCLKKRSRLIKALDNRFYVKFMQLEIGLSSICMSTSGPMLITFDQPLFELISLLLCGQSLLFKVETYCSRTEAYYYGVKT